MYFTGFHLFTYQKIPFDTLFVGVAGYTPTFIYPYNTE